jgi:hypothetical protein
LASAPQAEAVAEVELGVRGRLARVHVVDHAGGVVHDRVPGVEDAAEHVQVLRTREGAPGAEDVVEPAQLEHEVAPERHHGAVAGVESLDGAGEPARRTGGGRPVDERVIEHAAGHGADVGSSNRRGSRRSSRRRRCSRRR